MNHIKFLIICIIATASLNAQEAVYTSNDDAQGTAFSMHFKAGEGHNHPSFAIWVEDMQGNMLQTLFVTRSVGTGTYAYKPTGELKWEKGPGKAIRPAALPYWFHKRGALHEALQPVPTPEKPVPDAYTGATPQKSFQLRLKADQVLNGKIRLVTEINQPWDVNDYWTNNKYPENNEYLTSCQPALVYAVTIDLDNPMDEYYLNPVGHSHPYGKNGKLYTNLTTFTSALNIFSQIQVEVTDL